MTLRDKILFFTFGMTLGLILCLGFLIHMTMTLRGHISGLEHHVADLEYTAPVVFHVDKHNLLMLTMPDPISLEGMIP